MISSKKSNRLLVPVEVSEPKRLILSTDTSTIPFSSCDPFRPLQDHLFAVRLFTARDIRSRTFQKRMQAAHRERQRTAAQSLLPFGRKRCDSGDRSRSHRCSAQKLPFSFFLSVTHKIHDFYKSLSAVAWQAANLSAAALFPSRSSQCANSVVCGSSRSKRPIRLIFRCSRSADRSRICPPCVLSLLR